MLQAAAPRLVLASASASRRALLTAAGLAFTVCPADLDESSVKDAARAAGWTTEQTALRLAFLKAEAVARLQPDAVVIGSDQILVCEDRWFDKPGTPDGVRAQLQQLAGRPHRLVTAVVCFAAGEAVWQHVVQPRLVMRAFSAAFLDAYVAQEAANVGGSVGGYRLEGPGVHLFEQIEGEHSAILGLPLLPLLGFLRERGVLGD